MILVSEWLARVTDRGKSRPRFFELINFLFKLGLRRTYDMENFTPALCKTYNSS